MNKNEGITIPENDLQTINETTEDYNLISQVIEYARFRSSQDQIAVKIQSLKLKPTFEEFSIAFSFVLDSNDDDDKSKRKRREELRHIVQVGNNNRKLIQISIHPSSSTLCISYKREIEYEYLFSQTKIKSQQIYHALITYKSELLDGQPSYCITMYLNSMLQGQVVVTNPVKFVPKSLIYIGSESAEDLFKGRVGDFVLSTEEMTIEMVKEIVDEKNKSNEDFKQLPLILNILGDLEVKNEIGRQNTLLSLQNKHAVPFQLQKTHGTFIVDKQMKQQLTQKTNDLLKQYRERKHPIEDLRDSLLRNNDLNSAMRQMCLNYRWIFTTISAMSPPIDDGVGSKLPFFSLHTLIANGNIAVNENYPIYVIESTRFHRVLSYSKVKISKEQLEYLAEKAGCIKTYEYEQLLENNNRQKLRIEGIFYDQFMMMARDVCLTEEEILNVKQQSRINPHQEEEDIQREKKEWAAVQSEFIKDNKKPMFIYNSIKHLQRVLKLKKIPEPFKECNNYKIVGFYLILPPFRSMSDIGYYNKFVQVLFEYRYQNSINNLFKAICHGRLSRCEITIFHSFVIDKLQLENSPAIEEIFKMLCISNPTSFNEKEFSFFLNNWCIGSIYQHNVTGVQIYIDCFNQKYLEVDPNQKLQAEQSNQMSGPSIQNIQLTQNNNANINNSQGLGNNVAQINNSAIGSSHLSQSMIYTPVTSYFQYRVIIEEYESIYGICGIEKDGYFQLESLKVITNKRKIQIAPLRNHRQFQNSFIYDKKLSSTSPTPKNSTPNNQLSPNIGTQTTATPTLKSKQNPDLNNISPSINNQSPKQLSLLNDNVQEEVDLQFFQKQELRKKSSTVVLPKQQIKQDQNQIQENNNINNNIIEQRKNQSRSPNMNNDDTSINIGLNQNKNHHIIHGQQNQSQYNRHLTISVMSPSSMNNVLDKKQENNQFLQSTSDRNIRFQDKQEDNFFLYFDPSEMRKVTGFEILINQDHECPIRYQENQLMMNISSQKYVCRFSTLQLLSVSSKSPKISIDFQNNNQMNMIQSNLKQQISNPNSSQPQSGSIRSPPQSPQLQLKQIQQQQQFNQFDGQSSQRPTQANSNHDNDGRIIHIDQGFGSIQSNSSPISSGRQYTNHENYPILCNMWNSGKFQVIINHCTNCETHTTTTWHEEADFCEKFNDLGNILQSLFPNIEIIGNYEKPKLIEAFEVYIRGVGPADMRDAQGRILLYKKNEPLKSFLLYFQQRIIRIFDGLILLSLSYADSSEMEKVQDEYLKRYESLIPAIWQKFHEYPCIIPERQKQIEEEKRRETETPIGTAMICKNWGCGKSYEQSDDTESNKQCIHHPKPFDLGSMHGLWPESWSCCRGDWNSKGCTRGPHKGQAEKKFQRLCINHGEINPETKHPDSACGQLFIESEQKICRYHRGYYKKVQKDVGYWTCCTDGSYVAQGCHDDTHEAAQWPDPKAKIYFVQRTLLNPGLNRDEKVPTFEKSSLLSTIYRVTEQYKPYVTKKTQIQQERKANENEIRVCQNWGCEEKVMRFREIDNIKDQERRVKNCTYHPGYFDFGNVNKPGGGIISIAHQLQNSDTNQIHANAIRPHWTCCRKEWKAIGCKLTYHWGPVEATMGELKHGRWPDVNAMKYFKKQSSAHFKQKMGELVLTEDMARHYWYQFSLGKELIPIAKIGELCDRFKLSWMALSEDLSYHFKYFDVIRGISSKQLDNGNGFIEREKFTKWWFTPLDKYPINV